MHYVTNICRQFYPVYRKFINEIVIDSAVIIVNEMITVVANFYALVTFCKLRDGKWYLFFSSFDSVFVH